MNKNKLHIIKKKSTVFILILFLLFTYSFSSAYPHTASKLNTYQTANYTAVEDSSKINSLIKLAYEKIEENNTNLALSIAQEAYNLSIKKSYLYGLAHSQLVLAKIHNQRKAYPKALSYYLKSLTEFEKTKNKAIISDINYKIGLLYSNWEVYSKALSYLKKSNNLSKQIDDKLSYTTSIQATAFVYVNLNKPDSAIFYYLKVLDYYNSQQKTYPAINILEIIADINKKAGRYSESVKNQLLILNQYQKLGNNERAFICLNNLGFLYKYLNNDEKSLEYFKKALEISENNQNDAPVLVNIGILYHNKGNYEHSLEYIFRALKIRQNEKNILEVARIDILLATTYYHIKDFETAINYAKMAIEIGEKINKQNILYQAYLIVSNIYQESGNFEIALDYYQKYSSIKENINTSNQQKQTEILSKEYIIDKTEKELELYKAEEELRYLTLKQLLLEKEKQEKELALLKKNEILLQKQYRLEKATSMQRLQIVSQNLAAEKKDREISELNKDKKIKEYALKQKEREKKEQEREIELLASNNKLLERDKQLKELEVKEAKVYRNILIAAFFVVVLILFLILFYYFKKKKTNKILSVQNAEINKQKSAIEKQASELQSMNEHLIKLDNFKESLTSMIVHDLKNPLNTLLNISDSERVKQSAKQMLLMVMNILDIHKFEDTAMKLDISSEHLHSKAKNAVEQVMLPANEKNIRIQNKIPLTYNVQMDTEITERVFVNLLTNAIKYTPANGSIILNVKPYKSDYIRIEVKDTGEGIAYDKKHLIFDKFGQVEAKKLGQIRSTGLGLTFCKMAIEAHGGTIGVDSNESKGATFWFTMHKSELNESKSKQEPSETEEGKGKISANTYKQLKPVIDELSKLKYYEITALRKILTTIDDTTNHEIKTWKKDLLNAINSGNKDLYIELTNVNNYEK